MELSELSKKRLEGVDERLKAIVIECAARCSFPFNVSEGLRTEEQQREYVRQGKSRTMKSKIRRSQRGAGGIHSSFLIPIRITLVLAHPSPFPRGNGSVIAPQTQSGQLRLSFQLSVEGIAVDLLIMPG